MSTPIASTAQFDPAKLADIHLPGAINFWPIAPGWWILSALIILVLLIVFIRKARKSHTAPKGPDLKTQALNELRAIKSSYKEQGSAHKTVQQLSIFLRRYALSLYERDNVASLTDEQWLNLLDSLLDEQTEEKKFSQPFTKNFSQLLTEAPYQSADSPVDPNLLAELFNLSETLVETHHQGSEHV